MTTAAMSKRSTAPQQIVTNETCDIGHVSLRHRALARAKSFCDLGAKQQQQNQADEVHRKFYVNAP